VPTSPPVLATCDSEPIHLLGAIQPIGFLLAVTSDWIVTRVSENVGAYLDFHHEQIIGRPVAACVPADVLHDIRGRLQQSGEAAVVEPLFGRQLKPGGPLFAVAVHRSGDEIVLEFEEASGEECPAPTAVRSIIARVERHRSPAAVFGEAARQVRALTGFDRVMLYRFNEDGHGEVVGESVRNGVASFMGLRYPASDIPSQARALYLRNLTRIIVDVDSDPVAIMPALSPEGRPLDLSMSILRSVSPIHIEYLRNMDVRSSMSISIVQGERLWGLFACHHSAPKHVDLQMRLTAELFGQMFSYQLEVRQRVSEAIYDTRSQEIHNRIAAAFADPDSSLKHIPEFLADITDYVQSDGIGTYHAGEVELVGLTPTQDEFLQLVRFLNQTSSGRVFATNELGAVFPPATDYVMRAAGILAIPISRTPRDYLVFFRRESVQTVNWAGEPGKLETHGANGARLTPRKSFDAWREIVQGKCEPWTKQEMRAAESLRLTLIEVVLRMSETAKADRLDGRHRQELLIAELNHRVRNLLGLVRGLIIQVAATASDVPAMVEGLDGRILSMARAYDLLTLNQWTSGSLHGLLNAEAAAYGDLGGHLVLIGPDVVLQPKAFSAMALVVHELTTNARKYGALKTIAGQVTVETGVSESGDVTMAWRETGGPPVLPPTRRGFGSTILEQAIPFEVNGLSSISYLPAGFYINVVLPAAVAAIAPASAQPAQAPADAAVWTGDPLEELDATRLASLLSTSLVVEDNLFIAIDAEDLLRKVGAGTVVIARSVVDALTILGERSISFALLDVNLGSETSLPIARVLQATHVPFAFSTGYGEAIAMPEAMAGVPVISKPYHQAAIVNVLMQLVPAQGAVPTSALPSRHASQ
jgi:light-regulated signal transduction histidine kinase (bacteriophytochrome)/CheY-like chemotaxis protein